MAAFNRCGPAVERGRVRVRGFPAFKEMEGGPFPPHSPAFSHSPLEVPMTNGWMEGQLLLGFRVMCKGQSQGKGLGLGLGLGFRYFCLNSGQNQARSRPDFGLTP